MRALGCLTSLLLASCSSVLGIEDPRTGSDAGVDAEPIVEHLRFTLGDFKLAQGQRVHLGVEHVRTDSSVEDVTSTAIIASDNTAIVSVAAGTVESLAQPGTANLSATWGSLPAITLSATVTSVTCHPVINEIRTAGSAANDEWVEIYNPCATALSVDGWALKYRAAGTRGSTDDSPIMATLAGSMAPGSFRLYAGMGYNGASTATWSGASGLMAKESGSVGLRMGPLSTDILVDSIAYGSVPTDLPLHPFIETSPASKMSSTVSAARTPDGIDFSAGSVDGDNSTNFKLTTSPTPGTANAR